MSVKVRIFLMVFSFLFIGSIFFYVNDRINGTVLTDVTLPQIEKAQRAKYEYALKAVVDAEALHLAVLAQHKPTQEDLQAMVEHETDPQRFFPNDEGYFFTYTTRGVRVNVPVNKGLNGKDCTGLVDANGVYIVKEFINRAASGGGFVEYIYDKPGAGDQPKLSYVRLIPGTDIILGTGVYIDSVQAEMANVVNLIHQENSRINSFQLILGLGLLFVLSLAAFLATRGIIIPLGIIRDSAQAVNSGVSDTVARPELRWPAEIRDLAIALGEMLGMLKEKVAEADTRGQEAAQGLEQARQAQNQAEEAKLKAESARRDGMVEAAGQIEAVLSVVSRVVQSLAAHIADSGKGARSQAMRMAETATSMEEMNNTVTEVARSAADAAHSSVSARERATEGAQVVDKVVHGIYVVQEQSLELKRDMEVLVKHAQDITQIMSVISDIADQTNLLALNAAIEAARAGEAGRGFAVVADEVRKLAEKTMSSTADVSRAVQAIQHSSTRNMQQVDVAVSAIADATELAGVSGRTLGEIVRMVEYTSDQVRAIATASEEQSAASEEISRSIIQVNQIADSTVQLMSSASKSVEELSEQAQYLEGLIEEMKK